MIVVFDRNDNPTICIDITDKSKQPISTPYHIEFLQNTKGSEILLSLGYKTEEYCLLLENGTPIKLEESLFSQGVTTGSKLTSNYLYFYIHIS